MTVKIKTIVFCFLLFVCSQTLLAQETEAKKEKGKEEEEFASKKKETKFTEVVTTDSLPSGELLKRAVNWIKAENTKYKKSGGTTSGSKVECLASFQAKPKVLNPEVDYTGKFTMKVVIECKDSKYRYTVSDIKHISKNGTTSGGSIDNVVPECGSYIMHDVAWRKLKGEALTDAALVVADIKAEMQKTTEEVKPDEW